MNELLELLVDGEPAPPGWGLDRGTLYGDGIFETMLVSGGRIRLADLHQARFAEGCRRLSIRIDQPRIWTQTHAAAARREHALLRLQLTRGMATARGYAPTGLEQPRWMLAIFETESSHLPPRPLRVCTLQGRLGENPDLAGLKHCNRLEQVLARQAMAGGKAWEGLMASSSGLLISGTMSNVFVELHGEIVTPALDRCGVAGVMRAAVLREAAEAGIPVRVADLPFEAVMQASALALSNARVGLVAADELDGRPLAHSARLAELAMRVAP
jgi:4-amino-4-deoxychorismate lyase